MLTCRRLPAPSLPYDDPVAPIRSANTTPGTATSPCPCSPPPSSPPPPTPNASTKKKGQRNRPRTTDPLILQRNQTTLGHLHPTITPPNTHRPLVPLATTPPNPRPRMPLPATTPQTSQNAAVVLAHANAPFPASPSTSLPDSVALTVVTRVAPVLLSALRRSLLGFSPVAPSTGLQARDRDRFRRSVRTAPPTVGNRQATPPMTHPDLVGYAPTLCEPASTSSAVLAL